MKRILALLIACLLTVSLFSGCSNTDPKKVEHEVVTAVVVSSYIGMDNKCIQVAYDGVLETWYNEDLYEYYSSRHGATIDCILVTFTFEDDSVTRKLLYNVDIAKAGGD